MFDRANLRNMVVLLAALLFAAFVPGQQEEVAGQPAPGLQEEMQSQLAAIDREVTRLRKAGKASNADQLAGQLQYFRDRLAGKAAVAGKEPELHVVGLYEGAYPNGQRQAGAHPQGTATVEVSVTDRPLVLVLCAYEPVKWNLQLAKDVQLQKVILGGYHAQEAVNVPKEVPVEKHHHEGGSGKVYFAYQKDVEHFPQLAGGLKVLTRMDIATFQGTNAFKQTFVVGPANADWQNQRILAELAPVYQAATAYERGQLREAVQAIRFRATFFTRVDERRTNIAWADFTPSGPIAPTLQPLPSSVKHVAVDPKGPTFYGIASHGVVRLKAGQPTELAIDPALPQLSWPCGLTFDTKRRRLVLTSLGGTGHMYAYDPDAGKWSLITDMNNVDLQCFTYAPEADCYYGLRMNHGDEQQEILQYSAEGKLQRQIAIEVQIPMSRYPWGGHSQLVAVGQQLALLTAPLPDLTTPDLRVQGRCYLIDPASGKITYSEAIQPHAGKQKYAMQELEDLWQSLTGSDVAKTDRVMWQMAAGQKDSVAFLRGQLKAIDVPAAKRVQALIAQLDDDLFSVREQAFRDLQRLGAIIEPELQKALTAAGSAEVRTRIGRLLEPIRKDQNNDPEQQREQRAVQVLARIGTPEAIEYLRELAGGPKGATRTRAAQESLQHLGER